MALRLSRAASVSSPVPVGYTYPEKDAPSLYNAKAALLPMVSLAVVSC